MAKEAIRRIREAEGQAQRIRSEADGLAKEIERTRRRINALEYSMMPRYLVSMRSIKMKLNENERGNTSRLMKVKDMMLKERLAPRKYGEEG